MVVTVIASVYRVDYDVPGAKYPKYIILKTKCISSDSKQSYDTDAIFTPVL